MSLNASAKASARSVRIEPLNDATYEGDAWLNEVAIQAQMLGASNTITVKYVPVDEVDLTKDDREISTQSSEESVLQNLPTSTELQGRESDDIIQDLNQKIEEGINIKSEIDEKEQVAIEATRTDRSAQHMQNELLARMMSQMDRMEKRLAQYEAKESESNPGMNVNVHERPDGLRESWVVDNMVRDAFKKQKVWVHPTTGKRESPAQAEARMILFACIKRSLGKYPEYYQGETHGDNYKIVRNVMQYGRANSRVMIIECTKLLHDLTKTKDMSYPEYERQLTQLFTKLKQLERPVHKDDQVIHLTQGLSGDARYSRTVDTINERKMSYWQAHQLLLLTAHKMRDVTRKPKSKQQEEINHVDSVDKEENRRKKEDRRNNRDPKGGERDKGKPRRAKAPCTHFLMGNCYRDNCRFSHVTLDKLDEYIKSSKKVAETNNETPSGKPDDDTQNKAVCFQFMNLGTCEYGDKCRFSHTSKGGTNMVDEIKTPRFQTGTEVVIINVPEGSELMGLEAVVMGHKNQRLTLMLKKSNVDARLHELVKKFGVDMKQVCLLADIEETAYCDEHVDAYTGRAVMDPAASRSLVPSDEYCVPGTVRE
jgi:hypothetical protein